MNISIKRINGEVIFSGDFESMKQCVEAAARSYTNLSYANLSSANLSSANLSSANLRYANLSCANLRYANLSYANLSSANLSCADLCYANLRSANLSCADLCYANLSSANLSCADLCYANLSCAKNAALAIAITRILPDGDLIGWKKCSDDILVKLTIPAGAKRSHAFGRKCRAEFVDVDEVVGGKEGVTSSYGPRTVYRKGERVTADSWDENYMNECSHGIHFFITREEAEAW